jgi:hypothetical protein
VNAAPVTARLYGDAKVHRVAPGLGPTWIEHAMPKQYDPADHDRLDVRLIELVRGAHAGADHHSVATLSRSIIEDCADKSWLVRPHWNENWRLHGKLFPAWFYDVPPPDGTADKATIKAKAKATGDALYDLFESMVRLVLDAATVQQQKRNRNLLLERGLHYMELRGYGLSLVEMSDEAMAEAARPKEPTRAFCLLDGFRIRWKMVVPVQPRLWNILGVVLDYRARHGDQRIPFDQVEEHLQARSYLDHRKRVSNAVGGLNGKLMEAGFPWTLGTKAGFIVYNA